MKGIEAFLLHRICNGKPFLVQKSIEEIIFRGGGSIWIAVNSSFQAKINGH